MTRSSLKISIIIPVYNSSIYLDNCICSVLKQTYSNFELLLIDDGSIDNSLSICEKYASSDERIKVFSKKNSGVSSTRNFGLERVCGSWICFIDSDDSVEPNYLKNFDLCDYRADLYIQGYKRLDANNRVLGTHQFNCGGFKDDVTDFYIEAEMKYIMNSPWCKLFNFDIIKKNSCLFDESISLSEDLIFSLNYMKYVDNIYVSAEASYLYYIRIDESLSKKYVPYDRIQYAAELIYDLRKVLIIKHFIADAKFVKFVRRDYIQRCVLAVLSLYDNCAYKMQKRSNILASYVRLFKSNEIFKSTQLPFSFCSVIRYSLLHIPFNVDCFLLFIAKMRRYYLKNKI